MGVPLFYCNLLRAARGVTVKTPPKVDDLYIDANCVIHPTCRDVLIKHSDLGREELIREMVAAVKKELSAIIELVSPRELACVSVDGVPPVAKIRQQRVRRFSPDKSLEDDIYEAKVGPINREWDSVEISPGTEFMRVLAKALDELSPSGIEFVHDGHLSPGEGEFKIMSRIRDRSSKSAMIFSQDADLVFLCLGVHTDTYVMRSNDEFVRTSSVISYVDSVVSGGVLDYAFICFLLGNDFVRPLPAVNIEIGGYKDVLEAYKRALRGSDRLVRADDDGLKVDYEALGRLLAVLGEAEDEYYKHKLPRYLAKKVSRGRPIDLDGSGPCGDWLGSKGWKDRYYPEYFSVSKEEACDEYIKSLIWNLEYYFSGACPSWHWYYRFSHAPLASDLARRCFAPGKFGESSPVDVIDQLLMIIPPRKSYVLPRDVRWLATSHASPMVDMYPSTTNVYTFGVTKTYKTLVDTPYLDHERVKKIRHELPSLV